MMLSNRMTANRRLEKAARHASARIANWRSDSAPSVTFPWLSDLLLARRLRLRRLSSSAGGGSSWSSVEVTSESIVAIFDFARGMRARPVSKTPLCNSHLGRKKRRDFLNRSNTVVRLGDGRTLIHLFLIVIQKRKMIGFALPSSLFLFY